MRTRVSGLRALYLTVFLLLTAPLALADQVTLKNGDVLTGKVLRKAGNVLHFSTSYAGTLHIQWAQVRSLTTDEPVALILQEDDHVQRRRLAPGASGRVQILAKDAADTQEQDLGAVRYINPTPEESGKGYRLTGRANLAFARSHGNTDNEQLQANAEMVMRARSYRYRLGGEIMRARDDGEVSANAARLQTSYDWFFLPKRFIYAMGSLERDRFKDIDLRSVIGAGYGYQWIETEATKLSLRGGLDYVYIDHYETEHEDFAAFGWNIDFSHQLARVPVELFHVQDGYRGLNRDSAVVLKTRTGLRVPLGQGFNASLQLNVDWESDPAPDRRHTDSTVLVGLGYEFK